MTVWTTSALMLLLAFGLDLLLGDPPRLPHPVRWMGLAIAKAEPLYRRLPLPLTLSGTLFALGLVLAAWGIAAAAVQTAGLIHPAAGFLTETLLIYFCLSARSLEGAAMEVREELERCNLARARRKLAWIVGRDVDRLDAGGTSRAAVETVAENLVDGVISPLFYAAIGGAPLALAFKMVSTLDSMVGYKNDAYIRFGKASARLDDAANFIPARLAVPVIALAAHLLAGRGGRSLATAIQDGQRHTSPNAGLPEAAFAGALGIRLGGPSHYQGRLVAKPFIGGHFQNPDSGHIARACDLMLLAAGLFMIAVLAAELLLQGG